MNLVGPPTGPTLASLAFEDWPRREGEWFPTIRGGRPDDQLDFHLDLGCGKVPKARIGIDHHPAPGVAVVADLERLRTYSVAEVQGGDAPVPFECGVPGREHYFRRGLPFWDDSVESIICHHALEHIGHAGFDGPYPTGLLALMDECWRILKPGAPFRIIAPLFPSTTAVEDPDHKHYFMEGTFNAFCGTKDNMWCDGFSVPYVKARFEMADKDVSPITPPEKRWTSEDAREIRVTLRAVK